MSPYLHKVIVIIFTIHYVLACGAFRDDVCKKFLNNTLYTHISIYIHIYTYAYAYVYIYIYIYVVVVQELLADIVTKRTTS